MSRDVPHQQRVEAPTLLPVHEFEDGSLGEVLRGKSLVPRTEWTDKVFASVKQIDVSAFNLLKGFGDTLAAL